MINKLFNHFSYYQWWKNLDKFILTLIVILFLAGLFFSLVSTSLIASDKLDTNSYFFFFKHLIFVTIGLLFTLMIITKRNSTFRNKSLLFSIGSFFYLALSFTWLNQEIFLYPIFPGTDNLFEIPLFVKVILNFIGLGYFFYKIQNMDQLKYFFKEGKFI